jgi:uncharacterized Zn-finger protein
LNSSGYVISSLLADFRRHADRGTTGAVILHHVIEPWVVLQAGWHPWTVEWRPVALTLAGCFCIITARLLKQLVKVVSTPDFITTRSRLTVPNPDTASSAGDGSLIPSNAENRYEVSRADLPLHCPMDGMSLWNSHPRVFLPIEATGQAKCPYCGADYTLKD